MRYGSQGIEDSYDDKRKWVNGENMVQKAIRTFKRTAEWH